LQRFQQGVLVRGNYDLDGLGKRRRRNKTSWIIR